VINVQHRGALAAAGLVSMLFARTAGPQGAATPATPYTAATLLRSADLRADVDILRRAYLTLHPGLYRYNTRAEIDAAFDELDREFTRDRTLADAYLAFSVFAAHIRCGHTYANFFNQPDDIAHALFEQGRVPFHFRWLGDRMIVTRSFTADPRVRPGVEVLAINGTPAATILGRLMTIARADGGNDAKRVASLEVQGIERLEAFDIYFPLFFPFESPRQTLQLSDPDDPRPVDVEVPTLSPEARRTATRDGASGDTDPNGAVFEFRVLDDGIAYLRMPTWALYNSKWDWKAFLAQTFDTLVRSGATDLVVDVRGNEGGLDVGDEIVKHLTTREVRRPTLVPRVRYRRVPAELAPYLDTWDPSFKDWGAAAVDSADGFFRLRRSASDDPGSAIVPAAPTFAGRTWVLVGPTNSSATFQFAQLVQENRLGTLVGQPTGGNQRGINGGAFFFLRLPGSRIELDLPLIGTFPVDARPDAGIEPDIRVAATPSDIARGRDVELEAVRARIRTARAQG
jgi:hypothetical protein